MTKNNIRAHEVEYSFDTLQVHNPSPEVEQAPLVALSAEEFIQKRKAIVDKLIEMSVDTE